MPTRRSCNCWMKVRQPKIPVGDKLMEARNLMSTNFKKLLASLLAIAMVIGMMPNLVLPAQAAGEGNAPSAETGADNGMPIDIWDGTSVDTSWYTGDATEYILTTAAQLKGLEKLSNQSSPVTFKGITIKLGANIVFNEGENAANWSMTEAPDQAWEPIAKRPLGTKTVDNVVYPIKNGKKGDFQGVFDGNGCYISGLYCARASEAGFIGYATSGAKVMNLAIINSYFGVDGNFYDASKLTLKDAELVASFVVRCENATLENLYTDAYVENTQKDYHTGGIAGYAKSNAVIKNCVYAGTIETSAGKKNGSSVAGNLVGGIVGGFDNGTATVQDCLFAGIINTNDNCVGMIVGRAWGGTITRNVSVGTTSQGNAANRAVFVGDLYPNKKNGNITITNNVGVKVYDGKVYGTNTQTSGSTKYTITINNSNAELIATNKVVTNVGEFCGPLTGITAPLADAWVETGSYPVPAGVAKVFPQYVIPYGDTGWYEEDGDGSPYYISTVEDLYGFAILVNGATTFDGEIVYLANDIEINQGSAEDWAKGVNLPDREWISIGDYSWTTGQFKGTFDGQNNSISGLYQVVTDSWGGGLFNSAVNATIQNLALVNSYFKNTNTTNTGGHMGSICTRSQDTSFLNLYSDAIMYSEYALKVGGITGVLVTVDDPILVENCVFAGSISTNATINKNRVGGIVGSIDADGTADDHVTIKNCLNLGNVIGNREVGGIVGNFKKYTAIENCVNAGTVTCKGSGFGGIVGWASSPNLTLKNCHYVKGTSTIPYSGNDSATFVEKTNVTAVSLADLNGDLSALGLTDWTAYECDFPVPTGVKAIYEKHVTPDIEHDESGNAADCGNPKVCPDCGEVLDPATGAHEDSDDEDFKCDVCGQDVVHTDDNLKFNKKGISFQSYIGLQPTILKSLVEGFDKVYVMANGEKIEGFLYQESVYVFDKMILSTEMTKKITFTIYGEKDGKLYRGEEFTTSLAELALAKIEAFDAAGEANLCTILVDMLNYGAEAQKIYTSDATVLANANLGDYAKYASTSELNLSKENSTDGEGEVLVNEFKLSLQSVLEINLTFAKDMTDYSAIVTVNGEDKEYGFEPLGENSYVLRIPVGAMLVHEDVAVKVFDPTGALVTPTYTCSVESIAKERIAAEVAVDLVTAMMHYCDAVINVFGK